MEYKAWGTCGETTFTNGYCQPGEMTEDVARPYRIDSGVDVDEDNDDVFDEDDEYIDIVNFYMSNSSIMRYSRFFQYGGNFVVYTRIFLEKNPPEWTPHHPKHSYSLESEPSPSSKSPKGTPCTELI